MVEVRVIKELNSAKLKELQEPYSSKEAGIICFKSEQLFPELDFEMNAGFDLKIEEQVELPPDSLEAMHIRATTGCKWAFPKGFVGVVVPRSGISQKTPIYIANAPGTIEHSYRGDISLILGTRTFCCKDKTLKFNFKDKIYYDEKTDKIVIKPYTKMAQFLIYPTLWKEKELKAIYFVIDEDLYNNFAETFPSIRGEKGYGSTGL